MLFISKNQYKLIQFYMKWPRFDFKHFCILSGIEPIKFKHESCLIPSLSVPLQAIDEAPLLNIWVSQPISYRRWSTTSQLDWDPNFSLAIPIRSSSILPFFLGRVLTSGKAPDLIGTYTWICSIDCVNSYCRTSQYNVPFIVPWKILAAVVSSPDMPALLPSPVFICWMQSGSSRSSSLLQIFTWFFRFRT